MPETLDGLLKRLTSHLTAYQNVAYGEQFMQAIVPLRQLEEAVAGKGSRRLTETVAKNLAKLMSYKDEYEVARLYSDPAYFEHLRRTFAGEPGKDYQLHVHMAPPAFSKKDSKGHLVKREYGPWIFKAFKLLSRFKGLRGTAFDPFGRTEERRQERALIQEYQELLDLFKNYLSIDNYDKALELANLADDIRGFGHVKEANIQRYKDRKKKLIAEFCAPAQAKAA